MNYYMNVQSSAWHTVKYSINVSFVHCQSAQHREQHAQTVIGGHPMLQEVNIK